MFIISFSVIIFPTLFILCALGTISALDWKHNQAISCDFKGNDLTNIRISDAECNTKCASLTGCTHFTWTSWQGGTCWMKKGPVTKADAFDSHDEHMICGIILNASRETKPRSCSNPKECMSKDGTCGNGPKYCGVDCQTGPCIKEMKQDLSNIIDIEAFKCVFNFIDTARRDRYFARLKSATWKPKNREEAAVFLAHIDDVTDGLREVREYCSPGHPSDYATSWYQIPTKSSVIYYGEEWFQLSWPCSNHRTRRDLVVDPLNDRNEKEHHLSTTSHSLNETMKRHSQSSSTSEIDRVENYKRISKCLKLGQIFK